MKSPINTYTTVRNNDVIVTLLNEKCRFRKKKEFRIILPVLWPPNSPYLNSFHYSVWGILQEKVYKTCMTNLDDLKHRIRIEWAKLDHALIAAAVH